ncbi:MAG: transglycosylase SLT domain-containing protein [Caldilineaceae bacterium]
MRNSFDRLPAWVWLAVALCMLIVGLWLAYFVVVHPPALQLAGLRTEPIPSSSIIELTPDLAVVASDAGENPAPISVLSTPPTGRPDEAAEFTGEPTVTAVLEPAELPIATPTLLAPPTATVTPVPAPTVTAPPPVVSQSSDQVLAQAAALYRLGDYATARSQLATLLTPTETSNQIKSQALFEMAKAYLAEGLYAESLAAVDELNKLTDQTSSGTDASDSPQNTSVLSDYLRAEALAGLNQYDEAVAAYGRFLQYYPSTTVTVQTKLGRIYLAAGNAPAGDAAFRTAAEATTNVVHRVLLLEELAQLHTDAGRYGDAAAAYDTILSIAQQPNYRAQILAKAGHAYAAGGNEATAVERWRSAIAEAQTVFQADGSGDGDAVSAAVRSAAVAAAYDALVELVDRGVDFDLYERGVIDLEAEAYAPAVNAFSAFLESAPAEDGRVADALHGLGQAQLGAGDAAAAQAAFERVLNEYPDCACAGDVRLGMAAVLGAQGDGEGERRSYRTFARDFPQHPLAPEALWRSAVSALNAGNDVEGAFDLLTLADAFPQSARAPQALFVVGTGAFRNALFTESADAFGRLQRNYPDYRWDAVAYWLGRAQNDNGDVDAATQTWTSLVQRAPDIYYGILAAQSLRSLNLSGGSMLTSMPAIAGPATRLEGDDGSQAFADQWLAAWLQVDPAGVSVLPPEIAADVDLQAGRLLLELDARGDALEALERVYQRYLDNPQALYALGLEFERLGAYRLSLMSMSLLLQLSPANLVEDGPIFIQRHIYPRPFDELITQQAIANNIDPLLLFSLIRQESLFEEGARSVAAAQGLAQIIPDTGHWIAEQLGYPNYTNDLVYRPIVNVRFGAYYLDWVRDYLDGNMVSALVGYNAGPGNSARWREWAGDDDVRFVEILEMSEPRTYVKAIATNLYHYNRLYGTQ